MPYKFYVDHCVINKGPYFGKIILEKAYPNVTKHRAMPYTPEWRQFSTTWPHSEPVMLFEYMQYAGIDYEIVADIAQTDNNTFYPIALAFFDFGVDWFTLFPAHVLKRVKEKRLRVLFYYSEGDNPYVINNHLTEQCERHSVPREQVLFVSANSEAANIDYMFHVVDDELLFQFRNREVAPVPYHDLPRHKKFTALSRMHKCWRATVMTSLWCKGHWQDGYFSYGIDISAEETHADNPIQIGYFGRLPEVIEQFLDACPFVADTLDPLAHNDHTRAVEEHFSNSYLNIVLESHMDVDQSGGAFLTEKTFKPIKNAQPFIVFAGAHSLQLLRDMGYKTFDDVIDQRYDAEENTTKRWMRAQKSVLDTVSLNNAQLHDMYMSCKEDLLHNQQLFMSSKRDRLIKLLEDIHE